MAVTKKRLMGPAAVATGPATIYTVPAGTKTIVRKIHVQNPSGSIVIFTLSIGADAADTRIISGYSVPAAAAGAAHVIDWWGPYTLDAAEVIQASAGTNNILTITIDGEEITLG